MRLATEFIQLPYRFDAERLRVELETFDRSLWRPHPQRHKGNWSLPLVAVGGDPGSDATKGLMRPTPHLDNCPYVVQIMERLNAPVGRSRFMMIEGGEQATAHVDSNYYWVNRVRVHVPILTSPAVEFLCGERRVHMGAGEAWIFDNFLPHNVLNRSAERRVHLVIDTIGSIEFWSEAERGQSMESGSTPKFVPFDGSRTSIDLPFESTNYPVVMDPVEQKSLSQVIQRGFRTDSSPELVGRFQEIAERFLSQWSAVWSDHKERSSGWLLYRELLDELDQRIEAVAGLPLDNGLSAADAVRHLLIRPALNPDLASGTVGIPGTGAEEAVVASASSRADFERPIFIVCPPRSGSTLLFETLAQSPSVWTIGTESHALIESVPGLHPASGGWQSNRLTADAAQPEVVAQLSGAFRSSVVDRDGTAPPHGAGPLRLLEKTPKNALRVPFLAAAFPDARFVYLYRDPRETLSSMIDAWRSGRFTTYSQLPGWKGPGWSLLLIPGWRELIGKPLALTVAQQWKTTVETLLDDLEALSPDRWCVASYDRLVADPQAEIERLCGFLEIEWDRTLTAPLPNSRHTLTSPDPQKWRSNGTELAEIMPLVSGVAERARRVFASPPARRPAAWQSQSATGSPAAPLPDRPHPLRSVSTPSFAELLRQAGSSIILSTYQTGKMITIRAGESDLNTHFCSFPSPMGIALGPKYLAFGTEGHVWHYRNQPAVAPKLEPKGRVDACFLPVRTHFTGDIRVHEMAWAGDELWLVNTRFSVLCTLDADNSFVPRWRPGFVSRLAPEDRCHLNGLCVVDGRVRYVTALGESDEPAGWRERKAYGGLIIDVDSGETIARGLSMPHSPRWYRGDLWVLESGKGELGKVDLKTGKVETVAQLPGFTRGLTFAGPFALVGLSQVRESVFGGIPLTERMQERVSGVWIVDLRTGAIGGLLKFEDLVQEIFDVQMLPGLRYPEMIEPHSDWVKSSFVIPDAALRETATA